VVFLQIFKIYLLSLRVKKNYFAKNSEIWGVFLKLAFLHEYKRCKNDIIRVKRQIVLAFHISALIIYLGPGEKRNILRHVL